MAKLYEIDEAILACIDLETGEIVNEEQLNTLQIERDAKVENIALWFKNSLSDAEAYKREKDVFADKERAAKSKAEQLKQYLIYALNGEKFKTDRVTISYRKSQSIEIENVNDIPKEFLKIAEPTADKTALKEELKAGRIIEGVALVEKQNIQIK